jgi:hypothetical protein
MLKEHHSGETKSQEDFDNHITTDAEDMVTWDASCGDDGIVGCTVWRDGSLIATIAIQ